MRTMQSTWGVAEARAQLGTVLDRARSGQDQIITSRGSAPVRVTSNHTPTPSADYVHYLLVALAERDAGAVFLATKDDARAVGSARFLTETSSDVLVWVFEEFGPEWCADYARTVLLTLRALQSAFGLTQLATLPEVVDGLRRSTYSSRLAAIVSSSSFARALRSSVATTFPEQQRRAVMGDY